jgi:hypothetical protein
VLGWWLYQIYAVFEDANIVKQTLALTSPNRSIGIAAGGLPVEGSLYGESIGFLAQALLGLKTAGLRRHGRQRTAGRLLREQLLGQDGRWLPSSHCAHPLYAERRIGLRVSRAGVADRDLWRHAAHLDHARLHGHDRADRPL